MMIPGEVQTCTVHGFVLVGDPPTMERSFRGGPWKLNPGGRPPWCKGCRDAGEGPHLGREETGGEG